MLPRPEPNPAKSSRGSLAQLTNRFVSTSSERDAEFDDSEEPLPRTQFIPDHSLAALAYNDSPDIGFRLTDVKGEVVKGMVA